jgi:uncharacterized protein
MTTTRDTPTRAARWGERLLRLALRLPRATTEFTVTTDLPVPMRDGARLLADHYAPVGRPLGTILMRGPYGRRGISARMPARIYASQGYHVVLQSVRGTFGSGGEFDPTRTEVEDGADTVAWLRNQPWFTGQFVTMGGSYLGLTQWALMTDPPPELAGAIVVVGPHDFSMVAWGAGAFALNDLLTWSDIVAYQEEPRRARKLIRSLRTGRRLRPVFGALPLGRVSRRVLGNRAPWYETWLAHPDMSDDYWAPAQHRIALERVDVPVLLLTGWQDLFLGQTLEQYRRLAERGIDVTLTVGPWTHAQNNVGAAALTARRSLEFLSAHLHDGAKPQPRVRVYVTGHGRWRDYDHWPPPTDEWVLHLAPGDALDEQPPPPDAASVSFTYDPTDPTPTIGGRLLGGGAGYLRDGRLADRDDVLTFTGAALPDDLEVLGTPYVELAHASDIPYVDVFARISEVDRRGRSRNVSDGFRRLAPNPISPLRFDLDPIAHRFRAGHRVRLIVAGGSHPRYSRNPGTGEPPLTAERLRTSTHTIGLDGGVSRLVLPVSPVPR